MRAKVRDWTLTGASAPAPPGPPVSLLERLEILDRFLRDRPDGNVIVVLSAGRRNCTVSQHQRPPPTTTDSRAQSGIAVLPLLAIRSPTRFHYHDPWHSRPPAPPPNPLLRFPSSTLLPPRPRSLTTIPNVTPSHQSPQFYFELGNSPSVSQAIHLPTAAPDSTARRFAESYVRALLPQSPSLLGYNRTILLSATLVSRDILCSTRTPQRRFDRAPVPFVSAFSSS